LLGRLDNTLRLLAKQRRKGLLGGHQATEKIERHGAMIKVDGSHRFPSGGTCPQTCRVHKARLRHSRAGLAGVG